MTAKPRKIRVRVLKDGKPVTPSELAVVPRPKAPVIRDAKLTHCIECGSKIVSRRGDAKFCRDACKAKAYRARKREGAAAA